MRVIWFLEEIYRLAPWQHHDMCLHLPKRKQVAPITEVDQSTEMCSSHSRHCKPKDMWDPGTCDMLPWLTWRTDPNLLTPTTYIIFSPHNSILHLCKTIVSLFLMQEAMKLQCLVVFLTKIDFLDQCRSIMSPLYEVSWPVCQLPWSFYSEHVSLHSFSCTSASSKC